MFGKMKIEVVRGQTPVPSTFVGHAVVVAVDDTVFIDACEQMPNEADDLASGASLKAYHRHRFIMTRGHAARLYGAIGEVLSKAAEEERSATTDAAGHQAPDCTPQE